MQRYPWDEPSGVKTDAIIGFLLGAAVSYLLQFRLRVLPSPGGGFLSGGQIMQMLIVAGVGGGWYHFRKIL